MFDCFTYLPIFQKHWFGPLTLPILTNEFFLSINMKIFYLSQWIVFTILIAAQTVPLTVGVFSINI